MIQIIFGSVIYTVTLLGCYDGDTCKVKFDNTPEILEVQSIRFRGFDTPEIKGKCPEEKDLAKLAKEETLNYMENVGVVYYYAKKRSKYGDILVTAPKLQDILINKGLAREYYGEKKESWCE